MRNWGLVAKMLVFTCALLFGLISVGCVMFLKFEFDMLRDMSGEYRQKIAQSIKEQEVAETEALHENVVFNAQVLSEIAAVHLYNYDGEGIRQNLQTYMKYPDIVAIEIVDDFDEAFAAAWNTQPDAEELPVSLPDNFQRDAYFSVQVDAVLEEVKRGFCLMYYSDERLQKNLKAIRVAGEQDADAFHKATFNRFYRELISQIGIVVVILFLTLIALAFVVKMLIIRPVLGSVDFAKSLADGDFTTQLTTQQHDEIGTLVHSLNDMRSSIVGVLDGINTLLTAAQGGQLSIRGNIEGFSGDWGKLVHGLNSVIEAFVTPITVTAAYIEDISNGRIPEEITEEFQGDFSVMCENLNRLAHTLNKIIHQIQAGTRIVLNSAEELTESSQQVYNTSTQQAVAVKEIVSTMEDSDQLSKSIREKIQDVTLMTTDTKQSVTEGLAVIQNSLSKMNEIKGANAETITEVKMLAERINMIWTIVNMITEIADQTKIIAFNAELEASSAGAAGKNFRIVASEIRRLADNTVKATSQIKTRIQDVQKSSDRLIMTSEEDTVKITEGWELSQNLRELFENVHGSAEVSASAAEQIALSINQQTSAFEQILQTLRQISAGVESFAASTRSTTDAALNLKDTANILHSVIEDFVGPQQDKNTEED